MRYVQHNDWTRALSTPFAATGCYALPRAPRGERTPGASTFDDSGAVITTLVTAAIAILFILFLWFFPRTVARNLLDVKSPAPAEPASADTWFAVGCALIGLGLIVPAFSTLIYKLSV